MVKTLKIRGHHLKGLKEMLDKGVDEIYLRQDWLTPSRDDIEAYTEEMASLKRDIYKIVTEQPESKIRLTYSPDAICLICPSYSRKQKECGEFGRAATEFADREVLRKLGLKGGLHLSGEIVDKLRSIKISDIQ
jgi:hypothetical protein